METEKVLIIIEAKEYGVSIPCKLRILCVH